MTGFRVAFGGAQQRYGVTPDLTTLGKVIGGGLPVGAYGGRKDIMSKVAPAGPVYQAGTLSGNPLAVAAGLAMLRHLKAHPEIYAQLETRAAALCAAVPAGITVNRVGAMFTFFFHPGPVTDWESAKGQRHGALRPFLPRHAGPRNLFGALAIRSRVPLGGAHRGRHRQDDRGGEGCVRGVKIFFTAETRRRRENTKGVHCYSLRLLSVSASGR
jgi:hypothetical protein